MQPVDNGLGDGRTRLQHRDARDALQAFAQRLAARFGQVAAGEGRKGLCGGGVGAVGDNLDVL